MNQPLLIKPRIRGFVCLTAHPVGCAQQVQAQIDYVRSRHDCPQRGGPANVLVIGSSTGYGLASRITAAFGYGAKTFGVYYERPNAEDKPGSAGFYNTLAFEQKARDAGLYAGGLNTDAFSHEAKKSVIEKLRQHMGPIDLLVYSLASPRRTDPDTGLVYQSTLKPIGSLFRSKTLNTDKAEVTEVEIEPATPAQVEETVAVMGGADWQLWVEALSEAQLLAPGFRTVAYSYVGPEATWPIYRDGTIDQAKKHLETTVPVLNKMLRPLEGKALVSVNKGLVTQASSAIPVVPLYLSLLYKVMKQQGIHEGCIEQMDRLFSTYLYGPGWTLAQSQDRVRLDDWELLDSVQQEVKGLWEQVHTANLNELSDFQGYQQAFLNLFGFDCPGVDYDALVDLNDPFGIGIEPVLC